MRIHRQAEQLFGSWAPVHRRIHAAMSDQDYEAHVAFIEKAIQDAIAKGQTSPQIYAGNMFGYTPERYAQQEEILREIMQGAANVPRNRVGLMMGGISGAGKGFLFDKYLDVPGVGKANGQFLRVDPDAIKEEMAKRGMIPKVEGLSPMEASTLVHEEASSMAKRLANTAYEQGVNTAWDGTMSNVNSARQKTKAMRDKGYQVHGAFADIPFDMSFQSAKGRHRAAHESYLAGNNPIGGRPVPQAVINEQKSPDPKFNSLNRLNYDTLAPEFDSSQVWDTSDRSTDPLTGQKKAPRRVAALLVAYPVRFQRRASQGGGVPVSSYLEACQQFKDGLISYEQLRDALVALPTPHRQPPPRDAAEVYRFADEPVDDNSLFWVQMLYQFALIDDVQVVDLCAAAVGEDPYPPKQ